MRVRHALIGFAVLVCAQGALPAGRSETPEQQISNLQAQLQHANGGERGRLNARIAEELLEVANNQYSSGDAAQAEETVQKMLDHAKSASEIVVRERNNNKMKDTEILLRKTERRLEDVRRSVEVNLRPPLADAIKQFEQFRQNILDAMFHLKGKSP